MVVMVVMVMMVVVITQVFQRGCIDRATMAMVIYTN
jgi:hypothetical protein